MTGLISWFKNCFDDYKPSIKSGDFIMNIILTYDLAEPAGTPSKHSAVKNAMKQKGYVDRIESVNVITNTKGVTFLPNTSLHKSGATVEAAYHDIIDVCNSCDATLERFVAFEVTDTFFSIKGESYAS